MPVPGTQFQSHVPAFVAQVARNRAIAINALVGVADVLLLGIAVVHDEGVDLEAHESFVRRDRRFCPLQQAHRQLVRPLPQLAGLGVESLAHPGTARHLRQPQRFLEEAILPKRLDGFEVALAQTEQASHRLDQVGGLHALRYRQARIDHGFHLRRLAALPNQRQAGVRGQIQLRGLTDFKAGHDQLGEEGRCRILSINHMVAIDRGQVSHGFRKLLYVPCVSRIHSTSERKNPPDFRREGAKCE